MSAPHSSTSKHGPKASKLGEIALFAGKFLTKGVSVASLVPSSRWLGRETAAMVDGSKPQVIVELGAGTGAVTKHILSMKHPQSRVLCVEIDPSFAKHLRKHYPQVEVIEDSAGNLDEHLQARGIDKVDLFINCLPTPSLPKEVVNSVLDAYRKYSAGPITQITVMPWVFQGYYNRFFEEAKFKLVAFNLPPGGAYHCRGVRQQVSA